MRDSHPMGAQSFRGTIFHFILLNRLNVIWEVKRIMILKNNSESQEA